MQPKKAGGPLSPSITNANLQLFGNHVKHFFAFLSVKSLSALNLLEEFPPDPKFNAFTLESAIAD